MKIDRFIETSKGHFDLEHLEIEALENLKKTFVSLGYNEENIYRMLDLPHLGIASLSYVPVLLDFKLADDTSFNKLIKLFLFAQAFESHELYEDLFSRNDFEAYLRMGILERKENLIGSAINFYPCLGSYLATDHRYPEHKFPNAVMYLGQDSYTLARGTIRKPVGKTLDLCTGSGVHAILAAGHSEKVTGVDINSRAINFARFNSIFNNTGNVHFVQGNLLEPARDEKFDLILANPPFVPSPDVRIYYRDGGATGEDPLKNILENLDTFLTADGICQIFTLLVFQEGQDYLEKLHGYLGRKNFDLLVLATNHIDMEFFVIDQISNFATFPEYRKKLVEWLRSYHDNGIYRLADGIITVSRTREDRSPSRTMMKFRTLSRPFSEDLRKYAEILYNYEKDEALAPEVPVIRSKVRGIWKECLLKGNEPYIVRFSDDDLSLQAEIAENEYTILNLCDGKRSAEEIASILARCATDEKERSHEMQKCYGIIRGLAKKWVIEFHESLP